jgi:hypothetical protein
MVAFPYAAAREELNTGIAKMPRCDERKINFAASGIDCPVYTGCLTAIGVSRQTLM